MENPYIYEDNLSEKMKGSEFIFDFVDPLYYSLYKITLNCGGSNTELPNWLQNEKAFTNPRNGDNKCFKYAIAVALNYEEIPSQSDGLLILYLSRKK